MKLSEAMRAGIPRTQPLRFELLARQADQWAACAMGAAYLGAGLPATAAQPYTLLAQQFPELDTRVRFRGCECLLSCAIEQMNDYYRLSREDIADWLEARGY